jgi:hypothetical protein
MLKFHVGPFVVVAALGFVAPQWAAAQSSSNFKIPLSTLNAGVGDMSSASFRLSSSLGDAFFTGPSASTNFRLAHGLWISGVATAPVFQSAVSRKIHGVAGTFDLTLSLVTTNPTTEPRTGPSQTIVFTFDRPINAAVAAVTEGAATAGTPTFSGNTVVVGLTNVTNQQYVTVALTSVASTDGGTGGSASVRIGFLLGDVNQNRVVTLADLGLVNQQLAQLVTAANYLKDVNVSGTLSLADKGITNTQLTKALPAP